MEPEQWQALRARLGVARAAVGAGDGKSALAAIDEALNVDPDFLAVRSLRDRIPLPAEPIVPTARPASVALTAAPSPATRLLPATGVSRPDVSGDGLATCGHRARRRRTDRRLDAARSALAQGRLREATSAVDKVIELDPNLPELSTLTAQLDELRGSAETGRCGPRLVAAAVFIGTIIGASWLHDSKSIMVAAAPAAAALPVPSPRIDAADEAQLVQRAVQRYLATGAEKNPLDPCDVRVRDEAATATCQASPHVWDFTLQKKAGDWKVQSAQAER